MEHATTVSTDSNPLNQVFKHSNWQFNNRHHTILNRRKFGIIEYVFSREDAGTYTCRARVPQTGLKPNDEPNDDDDNDDDNGNDDDDITHG